MVSSEGSLSTVNQFFEETDVLSMPQKYNILEIYIKPLFELCTTIYPSCFSATSHAL